VKFLGGAISELGEAFNQLSEVKDSMVKDIFEIFELKILILWPSQC